MSSTFDINEFGQTNLTVNIHVNTFWLSLMKLGQLMMQIFYDLKAPICNKKNLKD